MKQALELARIEAIDQASQVRNKSGIKTARRVLLAGVSVLALGPTAEGLHVVSTALWAAGPRLRALRRRAVHYVQLINLSGAWRSHGALP